MEQPMVTFLLDHFPLSEFHQKILLGDKVEVGTKCPNRSGQ